MQHLRSGKAPGSKRSGRPASSLGLPTSSLNHRATSYRYGIQRDGFSRGSSHGFFPAAGCDHCSEPINWRSCSPNAFTSSWASVKVANSWSPSGLPTGNNTRPLPTPPRGLARQPCTETHPPGHRPPRLRQELEKSLFQRAADIVAKLPGILMLSPASGWPGREVALGDHAALFNLLQDDQLGIVPVRVPASIVQQVVLALRRDELEELPRGRSVKRLAGNRSIGQLGCRGASRRLTLSVLLTSNPASTGPACRFSVPQARAG